MGLFSGIMVNAEEKGYELSMEDVRIEFNEAFEVLNAEAASFESFCGAVEKLELLNASIQANGGKADKSLIAFLNQNNSLADALGIDLSMEDFNDVVVGSEISAACEGALSNIWEAIKNFFKNIWDGIKNFFTAFFNMFKSAEQKAATAVQNSAAIGNTIANGGGPNKSKFHLGGEAVGGVFCIRPDSLKKKINEIIQVSEETAKFSTPEAAMKILSEKDGGDVKSDIAIVKNLTGGKGSIWDTNDLASASGVTLGTLYKNAGWSIEFINGLGEDCKKLRAANEKVQAGCKVLETLSKMNDAQLKALIMKENNITEEAAQRSLDPYKKIAKRIMVAPKVLGAFMKDFLNILDDINSLGKQLSAEAADKKAKEEAAKKAEEAKTQQANPL